MKYSGRTAAAIVLFPDNKILLIKRSTPPFVGYWALPGGRMEPDEKIEETVIREVKEETGLDTLIVKKLGEYHEKGVQAGIEYDYYPACFLVKPLNETIKKQEEEISEIRHFNINEIPEKLAFEHNQMIRDFLASEKKIQKM